ncbi:MAG: preprotein translocase subunit SecA [Patescibacteria group bacterium]
MLQKILTAILGDPNKKEIKKIQPLVGKINAIAAEYEKTLTDEEIPKKTEEFKKRIAEGESLNQLLPEAFALVKTACQRLVGKKWLVRDSEVEWDMVPFDVQMIGGIILHQGKIAEMKTGEGKTLVCTMPIYLNALEGKGVFLVTVNDYLAQRDSEWMGGLYKFLGLSVGVILHDQNRQEKRAAYACDITYGTNNEFGFDYLRDNMVTTKEHLVQRKLHYAIVDEVDSILIDEARTPLIISAAAEESTDKYGRYSQLVTQLIEKDHYTIDEKMKTAILTDDGVRKMEELLGIDNIYTEAGFLEAHHIEQALKAHACYKKDVDYVVKEGEILIVDEFTGRLMSGRRYSEGLHQAIEAKENVEVRRESKTLATITLQNYFRIFKKLAGMTGTALTEAEEFGEIYKLDTIVIPTHRPVTRIDFNDSIYKNQRGKYLAVIQKIKELHSKGQPVLVGTISVEKSELLSTLLKRDGIPHNVLNAKQHEKEAEIIKNAGQVGAVTIATNMAGRGTDIKLGETVAERGGLYVLGTERHESRRIDNQLRGRSGRQGDAGGSQFYISMEDDLMRLFGAERVQKMMDFLKIPDDQPIENSFISNAIESAQKKVEGHHFDIRKHLVQYDDVMNVQRDIIYARRRKMLESESTKNEIILMIEEEVEGIVMNQAAERGHESWNREKILEDIFAIHKNENYPMPSLAEFTDREEMIDMLKKYLTSEYAKRREILPDEQIANEFERGLTLSITDSLWMEHIENMKSVREGIGLQGYAQRDPLVEYKQRGYHLFETLLGSIRSNIVNTIFKIQISPDVRPPMPAKEEQEIITNEAEVESVLTGNEKTKTTQASSKPEVNRNEPCTCGSGKKYKKCHGAGK